VGNCRQLYKRRDVVFFEATVFMSLCKCWKDDGLTQEVKKYPLGYKLVVNLERRDKTSTKILMFVISMTWDTTKSR
jgi:hypothetical protein